MYAKISYLLRLIRDEERLEKFYPHETPPFIRSHLPRSCIIPTVWGYAGAGIADGNAGKVEHQLCTVALPLPHRNAKKTLIVQLSA